MIKMIMNEILFKKKLKFFMTKGYRKKVKKIVIFYLKKKKII